MSILRRILSSWIFYFILFSATVGISSVIIFDQWFKTTATEQLLNQKRTIARAEASNTMLFFEKLGNSVAVLAQLSSVKNRDANAIQEDLDTFLEQRSGMALIGGVVLTDEKGIVKFNSHILETEDIGQLLIDKDYFIWAKTQQESGEYFISQPTISQLGESKGKVIVVVTSPVFRNDVFTGVVAATVKLQPLLERFLGLMKVSDQSEVYLFDQDGSLLYNNRNSEYISLNIAEISLDDEMLVSNIKSVLSTNQEGDFRTEKNLVAYIPVELGTQNWLLVIASSIEEIEALGRPFLVRQIAISVLVVFTLILFGFFLFRKNQFEEKTLEK